MGLRRFFIGSMIGRRAPPGYSAVVQFENRIRRTMGVSRFVGTSIGAARPSPPPGPPPRGEGDTHPDSRPIRTPRRGSGGRTILPLLGERAGVRGNDAGQAWAAQKWDVPEDDELRTFGFPLGSRSVESGAVTQRYWQIRRMKTWQITTVLTIALSLGAPGGLAQEW